MKNIEFKLEDNSKDLDKVMCTMKKQEIGNNDTHQKLINLGNQMIYIKMPTVKASNKPFEERLDHLKEIKQIFSLSFCHDYEQSGIKTSGNYIMDPDGQLKGEEISSVFCDLQNEFYQSSA